ncbi:MAG: tetratricopeptide repeat protein [Pirellulaceae bacterium]|nr:tetratricopeptide repeat protein [Pirellulaceae bacterium]
MPTLAEQFAAALQHHRAGELPAAERYYRAILAADPAHADAWHLLGLLCSQVGQHATGVEFIQRAIGLRPNVADYHSNLGIAHQGLRHWPDAVRAGREAVRLRPAFAEAWCNLSNALREAGDLAAAEDAAREAIRQRPDLADAHGNLGHVFKARGRLDEAAASFRQAIALRPHFPEALNGLGSVLSSLRQPAEAAQCLEEALRQRPGYPDALNNLSAVLTQLNRLDEAEAACRQALGSRTNQVLAHNNLGNILRAQGRLDEAVQSFRQALALRPDYAEAHSNLGIALRDQGKLDEAIASFRTAIRLKPDLPAARTNLSFALLLVGQFAEGLAEYEWRWRFPPGPPARLAGPQWDGSPLVGRRILLWAEQGLGDTIHFIRYANIVKHLGGWVIVECQPPLVALLSGKAGIDELIARGEPLPPFDLQAPLMSVPFILGTTSETIPAEESYLESNPAATQKWNEHFAGSPTFDIGIAWQGDPTFGGDRERSIRLAEFAPLAAIPGVRLVSLQKGFGSEQLAAMNEQFTVTDLGPELDRMAAFHDTAAIMRSIDLVVTSDSAIAHLAGALGVPAWVALPWIPEWRWQLGREDSPWYPSLKLFRQPRAGDWPAVFRRMAEEIRARLNPK